MQSPTYSSTPQCCLNDPTLENCFPDTDVQVARARCGDVINDAISCCFEKFDDVECNPDAPGRTGFSCDDLLADICLRAPLPENLVEPCREWSNVPDTLTRVCEHTGPSSTQIRKALCNVLEDPNAVENIDAVNTTPSAPQNPSVNAPSDASTNSVANALLNGSTSPNEKKFQFRFKIDGKDSTEILMIIVAVALLATIVVVSAIVAVIKNKNDAKKSKATK